MNSRSRNTGLTLAMRVLFGGLMFCVLVKLFSYVGFFVALYLVVTNARALR